jgi:hypothetical protein
MNESESSGKLEGDHLLANLPCASRRAQSEGARGDGNREVEGELYGVAQLS